jgi:hypothetical protein
MSKEKKSSYKIEVIETAKKNIPQRKAAKDGVMPPFPFSMMLSGSSGSGKTNLMMNLMTRDELYGRYFHTIIVFSPTAGSTDDMYKKLNLPKDNFIKDLKPEYLHNLVKNREKLIEEKGIEWVAKNARVCIILDDVIADRGFLESPDALVLFALLRHYLVAVIVMMQSYNKLPRALRLNCNAIMVFPALQSEVDVLKDEITPAGITKKDFGKVIEYATSGKHDFLYINRKAEPGQRVRKNLDEVIDLDKFKTQHILDDHVPASRRSAESARGRRPSETERSRGQVVQSGHSRSPLVSQVPKEAARLLLSKHEAGQPAAQR